MKKVMKEIKKLEKKAAKETDLSKLKKLLNTKYLEDLTNTPKDEDYEAIIGVQYKDNSVLAVVFTFKDSILTDVMYDSLFNLKGKKKEINEVLYHDTDGVDVNACVTFLKKDIKRYGDNPKFVSIDDTLPVIL